MSSDEKVVDDRPLLRERIVALAHGRDNIVVVAEVLNRREASRISQKPHVKSCCDRSVSRWLLWASVFFAAACFAQSAVPVKNQSEPSSGLSSGLLNDFFHTAWTEENGAPANIWSFAQTTDGYLWMGTTNGLYRFDGTQFERYEPQVGAFPDPNIYSLLADSDGGLWISYQSEGLSFLKNNRLTNFGAREGLPPGSIIQMALDRQGDGWAASLHGLLHLRNGHWDVVGAESGYSAPFAHEVMASRDGTIWADMDDRLFYLSPGDHLFRSYKAPWTVHIAELADGSVLVSPWDRWVMPGHVPFLAPGQMQSNMPRLPDRSPGNGSGIMSPYMFAASDGSIWSASQGDGLTRFPDTGWLSKKNTSPQDAAAQFTHADGLTSDTILAIFEDREGNIWVSTNNGLDRFRKANIHRIPLALRNRRIAFRIAADSHDGVWGISQAIEPLLHLNEGILDRVLPAVGGICLYRDPIDGFWVCELGKVTRIVGGTAISIPFPPEVTPAAFWHARAITLDGAGDAWVSINPDGVYRLHNRSWQHFAAPAGSHGLMALSLWTDSSQRVWIGYVRNQVVLVDGKRVSAFSTAEGLALGSVTAFGGRQGQVWVGGDRGLAILQGDRFHMVLTSDRDKVTQISGIVEMENGDLWLNQASGLAHIPASEIGLKLKDQAHIVRYEIFDHRDGMPGRPKQQEQIPSAVLSKDGRIWVVGYEGIAWIDPAHIHRNPLPPSVSIQRLIIDGHAYDPSRQINLPAGSSNIQINYTALSLSIPERVQFRYRLEGIDKDWQEVFGRRTAFYTNLGPGRYQFRVIASNNDGVWNLTGATADFSIAPFFYQSLWFKVLCALAAAAILFSLYLFRLKQVTAHLRETLGARMSERERIARELHDTLLQGFQGLILRFQAVVPEVQNEQAGKKLESVLDRADAVLLEGRQRVRNLRSEDTTINELSSRLADFGNGLAQDSTVFIRLLVEGTAQPLNPIVSDEIYSIGREALTNAFQHSKANRIEVDLTYSSDSLTLRIRDDGVGIDPQIVSGGRAGHWGLKGMRERAHAVGGKLSIWSTPGSGTEIELVLPARLAYLRSRQAAGLTWIRRAVRAWW
jgi:signal transduction histidine kinase/ligand-binding sensor domain-containing protein